MSGKREIFMFEAGQRIKCIKRAANDIAAHWVGRYGTIMKKKGTEDGIRTYLVKIDDRIGPLVLWEDEMIGIARTKKQFLL